MARVVTWEQISPHSGPCGALLHATHICSHLVFADTDFISCEVEVQYCRTVGNGRHVIRTRGQAEIFCEICSDIQGTVLFDRYLL